MTTTVTCVCDDCQRDLSSTSNCEDYRLVLAPESIPPYYVARGLSGGAVTAMSNPRPINKTHHFCGMGCLTNWLIKLNTKVARNILDRIEKDESRNDF